MIATLPLFGGAAMILASAGTISLLEIVKIPTTFMMIFGSSFYSLEWLVKLGSTLFATKQRCSELLVPLSPNHTLKFTSGDC